MPKIISSIGTLASGAVISQVIILAASPIITRLYSPEEFGLLAIFVTVVTLASMISTLRYHLAIPIPIEDTIGFRLAALSAIIVSIFFSLSCVFILLFKNQIADFFRIGEYTDYLWCLPFAIFLSGVLVILQYLAIRNKDFKLTSTSRIGQTLFAVSIQLLASNFGGLALLVSQLFNYLIGSMLLATRSLSRIVSEIRLSKNLIETAKQYKSFPLISTWSGVCSTVGAQLPVIVFSVYFGPTVVGFYALANKTLAVPAAFIGTSVQSVFYSSAANAYREGNISQYIEFLTINLSLIAVPPMFAVYFYGDVIFAYIFGDQWGLAGQYASIMTPWILLQLSIAPIMSIFAAIGKLEIGLGLQIIGLTLRTIGLVAGIYFFDTGIEALTLFSTASVIYYLIFGYVIFSITKSSLLRYFTILFFTIFTLKGFEMIIFFIFQLPMEYSYLISILILIFCSLLYYYLLLKRIFQESKTIDKIS